MINHNPTQEQLQQLWDIAVGFVYSQNIHCAETIYQSDRVIENAYSFIDDICGVVGFADLDEEDDD